MTGSRDAASSAVDVVGRPILLCFAHLRWDFVYQRPQHLMTRFAQTHRVLFWEEPIFDADSARLERRIDDSGVEVLVPHLVPGTPAEGVERALGELLDTLVADAGRPAIRWYYTPMMFGFSRDLPVACTVYDCMDELSAFRFAPPELLTLEAELLSAADLVFTGGYSLFEAKRDRHPSAHPFPSSVDVAHFAAARSLPRPADATGPRFGFYGVIDERMDLELIAQVAAARPDWTIEMVGPVVKIDTADLPRAANIVYPGPACYADLPARAARWDVALMPFAINEATRYISPTKTPEYLAAGRPVVSTPVTDVVRQYGDVAAVHIADGAQAFIAACDAALAMAARDDWREAVDRLLDATSWDRTQGEMLSLIREVLDKRVAGLPRGHFDVVIVGAGFAGSVMAERFAADAGKRVLVVDRRPHVAGNAFDRPDAAGILIHQYGPHIFHTNSAEVFDYLSRFTEWRSYEHRVLADVKGQLVPIPINRTTLNALYGADLQTDEDAEAFLAARAEPVEPIETSEDVVVSAVGRELYETFFRGYTRKQWGLDPSELDKAVTARVPTRTNTDDRYFADRFQAMPAEGYTCMFERMLGHPNITLALGVDFAEVRDRVSWDRLVFTGPIDEFFDHRHGKLPYRSLRFRHETVQQAEFQPVAVVNYPSEDVPYTRITEYKHLTGQSAPVTSLTWEYPSPVGDPYYPIPRPENQQLYKRYEALALATPEVTFVGRLATYRYYNMDQVVGQALATYRRIRAKEDEAKTATRAKTSQAAA